MGVFNIRGIVDNIVSFFNNNPGVEEVAILYKFGSIGSVFRASGPGCWAWV